MEGNLILESLHAATSQYLAVICSWCSCSPSDHFRSLAVAVAASCSQCLYGFALSSAGSSVPGDKSRAAACYSKLQQATACSLLQPAAQQSVAFSWPSHGGVLRPRSPRLSRLTPRCEGTNVLSATGTAKTSKEYKDLSGALWVKMSDSQSFTVWFCRW